MNSKKNNGNGSDNKTTLLESAKEFFKAFKTVVMHKSPHLDEIVAYYLLRTYAGLNACIRFVEQEIAGTEVDHDRNGILPIGCGIDCRFNEHRKGIERIKGECATTLVAKYLGISDLPELKQLIAEVLACDTRAGCSPTQLAELVKVANRCFSANQTGLINWTMSALQAIVTNEQYHFTASPNEKSLVDLFKALDTGGHLSADKRVREHMFRLIHESVRRSEGCITELAAIIKAMYRLPRTENDVINWLETPLIQISTDQTDFQEQVDLLRKQKMVQIEVLGPRGAGVIDCLVVQSDSQQAQRAARYVGAKVVLVRNSKGNAMISIDAKLEWLNLSNVTRMIRWLELPVDGKNVNWKSLGVPGKHDLVPNWYYFKKGEQLFNGSQTNAAKPTEINTLGLMEVLKCAFHPELVGLWCKKRNIDRCSSPENLAPLAMALDGNMSAETALVG